MLPWRCAAEMGFGTRYTLHRNTASIKIYFLIFVAVKRSITKVPGCFFLTETGILYQGVNCRSYFCHLFEQANKEIWSKCVLRKCNHYN